MRSVCEGNSKSPLVLTEERGMFVGEVVLLGSRLDCCCAEMERRCFSTSACTRICSSVSNLFWSLTVSSWTCRSISRRALTSHSRRTVDSIFESARPFSASRVAICSLSFSVFTFTSSSLVLNICPTWTTCRSLRINLTTGSCKSVAVSGLCDGLVLRQLLMTFCNSGEYMLGIGWSNLPSLIF